MANKYQDQDLDKQWNTELGVHKRSMTSQYKNIDPMGEGHDEWKGYTIEHADENDWSIRRSEVYKLVKSYLRCRIIYLWLNLSSTIPRQPEAQKPQDELFP